MQENTRQTLITFNVPAHSVLVARGGLNAILEMVIDRCSHQPHACCRVDPIADCPNPRTGYIWADMQQQVREKKGRASERSSSQGEEQEKQHATLAVGTQQQAATAAAGSNTCTDLDHRIVATLVPPTHGLVGMYAGGTLWKQNKTGADSRRGSTNDTQEQPREPHLDGHSSQSRCPPCHHCPRRPAPRDTADPHDGQDSGMEERRTINVNTTKPRQRVLRQPRRQN